MTEDFVDMDELFNRPFNDESADEVEKASLAPEGYYTSNPDEYPITISPYQFDDRRLVTVIARAEGKVGGEFHTALLRFKVSPDKRHAKVWVDGQPTDEEKTTFDMPSVLWTQARNAYTQKMGEKPKTDAALIEFIRTVPLRYKVGHFAGKLSIKGIEKAR